MTDTPANNERIAQMSPRLAEVIAAGEVIERLGRQGAGGKQMPVQEKSRYG